MTIIDRIKEYFYPFTYNKENFKLINKPTSYSSIYRNIYYSGNGGITFKVLCRAYSPLFTHNDCILNYNWTYKPDTFDSSKESFSYYKVKFQSLEDVEKYEELEYNKYLEGLKDVENRRQKFLQTLKENVQWKNNL